MWLVQDHLGRASETPLRVVTRGFGVSTAVSGRYIQETKHIVKRLISYINILRITEARVLTIKELTNMEGGRLTRMNPRC